MESSRRAARVTLVEIGGRIGGKISRGNPGIVSGKVFKISPGTNFGLIPFIIP